MHGNFVFSIATTVIGIVALSIMIKEKDGIGKKEVK
jgi:hypothetical protein